MKTNRKLRTIATPVLTGTLALALFTLAALMFNAQAADKNSRGSLNARDYKFVSDAAEGGAMEVSLGRLAAQKGADQAVRDFGQRMVTDHQKANEELTQLVSQKGATLPDSSKEIEKSLSRFGKLEGSDFDKAYIKDMVSDHKKDVKDFQTEADKAEDADLKGWVTKTLPTLEDHLRLAQTVESTVNAVNRPQAKLGD